MQSYKWPINNKKKKKKKKRKQFKSLGSVGFFKCIKKKKLTKAAFICSKVQWKQ